MTQLVIQRCEACLGGESRVHPYPPASALDRQPVERGEFQGVLVGVRATSVEWIGLVAVALAERARGDERVLRPDVRVAQLRAPAVARIPTTFTDLDAPVRRLAGPDVPAMPFSHPMQDWYMVNPDKIIQAIRELASW